MRRLRLGVMAGMARSGRQAAKAKPTQKCADATFGEMHAEARLDHPREIDPSPAHNAVLGQPRPFTDHPSHLSILFGQEPWFGTRRWVI